MNRWTLIVGSTVLCGLSALAGLWNPPVEPVQASREYPGPPSIAEAVVAADAMHLLHVSDPPGRADAPVCFVSEQPLSLEHQANLRLGYGDFRAWRGVVKLYANGRVLLEVNYDPTHPERFALWGDMMLYGDPELIAKMVARKP